MGNMRSRPNDPALVHLYRVVIDGLDVGGFSMVDGISGEIGIAEYREGDDVSVARKIPGIARFDNIILERGITTSTALIQWWNQVVQLRQGQRELGDIEIPPSFRRDMSIFLLNRSLIPIRQFDILEPFPVRFEHSAFDGTEDAVAIERLEIANEGFEVRLPRGIASFIAETAVKTALGAL